MYRDERNCENAERAIFDGVGEYGIPPLAPAQISADDLPFISFNFASGCKTPGEKGVHFFLDDYQFHRIWAKPDRYIELLRRFRCVCSPDFSLYTDYPKALQVYNHYRKHWLGAYWQQNGIVVIPTIGWSDRSSYDWCFDGEPENSVVAVSSTGTQTNEISRRLFLNGYNEMLERLRPSKVLFYGRVPKECDSPLIVPIGSFCAVLKQRTGTLQMSGGLI